MKILKTKIDVSNLKDEQIIILLRQKKLKMEQEIVRRYQKKLFTYLYRLVGNKEEAEDILQNVFLKVFNNIETFDVKRKFSSWIYRIAHNEAVNFVKSSKKRSFISLDDVFINKIKTEIKTTEKDFLEICIKKETQKNIRQAIKKLPKKYQKVLEMLYFQEKSYKEIGKILKKSVNATGILISRAKKKMQMIMKQKN